jgi:hypothetical protein
MEFTCKFIQEKYTTSYNCYMFYKLCDYYSVIYFINNLKQDYLTI